MKSTLSKTRSMLILGFVFIFPLFFLPITQEFYNTNKFFFLGFAALLIFLIATAQFVISKKIVIKKSLLSLAPVIFLISLGASVIFASPNKVESLLHPIFGFAVFFFLTLFYFLLHDQKQSATTIKVFAISALILAIIQIIFFVNPLQSISLPAQLQFLKQPGFTPIGSQLDLALFLGFFLIFEFLEVVKKLKQSSPFDIVLVGRYITILTIFVGLILSTYTIIQSSVLYARGSGSLNNIRQATLLPPFGVSWQTAIETLKDPKTALFGTGIGNYSIAFSKAKATNYNQTPLWQVTFNQSRSFLLHLLTETGLLGFITFILILFFLLIHTLYEKRDRSYFILYISYFILVFLLFPPSLPLLLLFFIFLAAADSHRKPHRNHEEAQHHNNMLIVDFFEYLDIVPITLATLSCLIIFALGYLLSRAYFAEYVFKTSIDGLSQNNAKLVYDEQKKAIGLNPFIERYRASFSQLNLLIANSIVTQKKEKITEKDRQTVAQAIQQAISEAKSAVALNSQKAANWENLAFIYRNIMGVARGSDTWAISSYQRAILLDAQNPLLRLNLGGVYYSVGNYVEAIKLFEQAVALKPNWANFYYNLAWAYYQNRNYEKAVSEMEQALQSVSKDSPDYKKAENELQQFRKNLSKKGSAEEQKVAGVEKLFLPQEPETTLSPKLDILNEATPEAR